MHLHSIAAKYLSLIRVITVLAVITICWGSLTRIDSMDEMTDIGLDKLLHVVAYMVISVLFALSLPRHRLLYPLSASIGLGVLLEYLQESMTSYRMLDIYDILANIIGSLVGIWLIWFLGRSVRR